MQSTTYQDPHFILKKYWGYDQFRALQLDIVQSVLDGNDTLALLPTGGGKSICFQVPALCMGGICIVVSPLIALMKDQVHNLKERGVRAYAIYSGMPIQDIDRVLDICVHGLADFLYLSPERLSSDLARERILQMNVRLIAVDEAHCISQWGYDFRPSYHSIAEIREFLPKVPIIAVTATATAPVIDDMQERLAFRPAPHRHVFQKSFQRENLAYVVLREQDKRAKLLDILRKVQGSGVVYVMNRKQTKEIADFLRHQGISAAHYHAGLNGEERSTIQDDWIKNKIRIIVATNAFGMGIDKPDVRVVVHLTLPDSLEAYFQEAGRAGRDGQKAYAVLLYNETDRQRLETQYEESFPPLKEIRQVYQALGSYFQLAIGAGAGRTFDFDLLEFSKTYDFTPTKASNALKTLVRDGYIELSENVFLPSTMQVIANREQLYDYGLRNPKMELLIKTILRSFQGVAQQQVNIRERQLAYSLNRMPLNDLQQALERLHRDKIIEYRPQKDVPQLTFLVERLRADDLIFDQERHHFLRERYKERMDAALHYAEDLECRSRQLLRYFGEQDPPKCGTCDVCLERHSRHVSKSDYEELEAKFRLILGQSPLYPRELVQRFPSNWEQRVLQTIDYLLDNGVLSRNEQGKLGFK